MESLASGDWQKARQLTGFPLLVRHNVPPFDLIGGHPVNCASARPPGFVCTIACCVTS